MSNHTPQIYGRNITGLDIANSKYEMAASELYNSHGDLVKINRKSLRKFGRNSDVGTAEEPINYLGLDPVLSSTNSITHFSSTDAGDTQTIRVEGMTISGTDLTFVAQNITLAGQTKTALTTPLSRVTRMLNTNGTETAGDVYVYEDGAVTAGVPNDLTTVGNIMAQSTQTTLFAGTSVASNNWFLITSIYCYLNKKTGGKADVDIEIKEVGTDVWRAIQVGSVSDSQALERTLEPLLLIPPNHDVRWEAIGSATGIDISAGINGVFADIVRSENR